MNKFLCSLVFVLSFSSVHAQSNDSQKEIQTLVQRVDSLEHELSYLKLTYELNTPQIRNPTKVSERCGPNRQECDFSSSD